MQILITGATGLIGKKLQKLLIAENHTVNYLTTDKNKITTNDNLKGYYWNPKTGNIDKNAFDNVEVIVHLAGATIAKRWTKAYKKEIVDSRLDSLNLIFETLKIKENSVKQIISASGTAIYPDSFNKIYTETETEFAPGFLSDVVVKWEACANQFKSLNKKVCVLRTGIVYDKNEGALSKILIPIRLGIGSSYGSGKQIQSWIHGDDIAKLYFFLIQKNAEGIYNAVSLEPISDSFLTKTIAKILQRPLFMPNIPRFFMQLILGDMCELLFTNKTISSQKAIDEGFTFNFPKIEEALQNILKK
jgi:uncharacterized protein (TIGR01777 family)